MKRSFEIRNGLCLMLTAQAEAAGSRSRPTGDATPLIRKIQRRLFMTNIRIAKTFC